MDGSITPWVGAVTAGMVCIFLIPPVNIFPGLFYGIQTRRRIVNLQLQLEKLAAQHPIWTFTIVLRPISRLPTQLDIALDLMIMLCKILLVMGYQLFLKTVLNNLPLGT